MWKKILLVTVLAAALAQDNQHLVTAKDESLKPVLLANVREQLKSRNLFEHDLIPQAEKNPEYWKNLAYKQLDKTINTNKAKNVILFVGDGMSSSTVTAARILKGQRKGKPGEEESLSFENFPYTGLSKTYCTNSQVADSGCAGTALFCGVKTNILTIGVTANVQFNNCSESMDPKNHVSSIAQWAQEAGKSTGFVTTTKITDDTPSALYAHVANRYYENDADVRSFGNDPSECIDIATQLVTQEPGRNFDVIMGGGLSNFLHNRIIDVHGKLGKREDNKYLLYNWQSNHPKGAIVTNRKDLLNLNISEVSSIMGIFQTDYMDYHLKADPLKQPTLAEMTEAALKLLKRNDNGYFILIEGGMIDVAHHETKAALALDETLEFEKAIKLARDMTDSEDTLIVVTSDHAHPLTISGYSGRGSDILGLNQHTADANGEKYLTLNYAMGPKHYLDQYGIRINLENMPRHKNFKYPSYIHAKEGQHSGDDVAIYASGPFAHLFSGVMEESTVPHLMAFAACIGSGRTMCSDTEKLKSNA